MLKKDNRQPGGVEYELEQRTEAGGWGSIAVFPGILEAWINVVEVEIDLEDTGKVGLIEFGAVLNKEHESPLSIQESF